MTLRAIKRFYHTLRYLKVRQVVGRLLLLRRSFERPQAFARRKTPPVPQCHWHPRGAFPVPTTGRNVPEEILAGRLQFLNTTVEVGWPPRWGEVEESLLWKYNLHYGEWLWVLDYQAAKECVADWIKHVPLARGSRGWEPYPVSLRLQNWCALFYGRHREQLKTDHAFEELLWKSLYLQAEWLRNHIEVHLLGNHLFENGAALALLGSCFSGSAAATWLREGKRILHEQVPEQILRDGVHFERSPMYHGRMVFVLATLVNTQNRELGELLRTPLERAARALSVMCHPDGRVALLNDSVLHEYSSTQDLCEYTGKLLGSSHMAEYGLFALKDAGYFGARYDDGTYLICDAAPIGPDYIPGHAHADIFTFELSLNGHRVVVDSGVYDYEVGPMRKFCRSTRAHNTVEIEKQDQSEVWKVFRVARRGRPRDLMYVGRPDGFQLIAWHDGYQRLSGRPIHTREFTWRSERILDVLDTVISSRHVEISSRVHLHPNCRIVSCEEREALVEYPAGRFRVFFAGEGSLEVESSLYCPEFRRQLENQCLVFSAAGRHVKVAYRIEEVA